MSSRKHALRHLAAVANEKKPGVNLDLRKLPKCTKISVHVVAHVWCVLTQLRHTGTCMHPHPLAACQAWAGGPRLFFFFMPRLPRP